MKQLKVNHFEIQLKKIFRTSKQESKVEKILQVIRKKKSEMIVNGETSTIAQKK
jgi:hypothetical protein